MPFVDSEGVRVHYEVEGRGPSLVLLHGLGGSLELWREAGYVEGLKDDYRLVLMDARGHGGSGKPHDVEAYGMEFLVGDVVAVLDDLGVGRAHFLGYSMGGVIGFGVAKFAAGRFRSLIVGGAQPYDQESWKKPWRRVFERGVEAALAVVEEVFGSRMSPGIRALCLANDLEALIALTSAGWPSFGDVLPSLAVPCMVFVGEADGHYSGARECVKAMPNAVFVSLPGLDHVEALFRTDLVLPHVVKFLAELGGL